MAQTMSKKEEEIETEDHFQKCIDLCCTLTQVYVFDVVSIFKTKSCSWQESSKERNRRTCSEIQ